MPRSLCSCPLGVRALKAPIGFKGPDQPQLEPPLTPLSMGPGAVFKLGLWPSVAWAALLGECWSGLVLVIPALGYCAPWFGPWPSDFTLGYCSAMDLPGNSWNWSWYVWADSVSPSQSCIISELVLWCGLSVGCGGCLWRFPAHLAQVLWGCALAAVLLSSYLAYPDGQRCCHWG